MGKPFLLLLGFIFTISLQSVENRRVESLDPNGGYIVAWDYDFESEVVTFEVTVRTTGYVGFGISNQGGMSGADVVIGGIWPNGTTYFNDYHALGEFEPLRDEQQDWSLLEVSENSTHTTMSFYRVLNTCDEHDTPITNDTTNFIWSFGQNDRILYHGPNRGTHAVNILDPPMPELDLTKFEKWSVSHTMTMPSMDTTYWCSVHKMPKFEGKHHVVAFKPYLPSIEALTHSHHYTVYKCKAPEGTDPTEFFDPYVGTPGGECYGGMDLVPIQYCNTILYVWAIGGKPFLMPEHVGYPVNEWGHDEYVMFEIHYDNPNRLPNVRFEAGVEIYHTPTLRQFDAGLLMVSHQLISSHLIPPKSVDYTTVGHCSADCTLENIPSSGINIFNTFLHSHLSGRKLKVRQFRGGNELPWIANDANYAFDYQQSRPLREEIKVLPGDQLSYECVTDTTWTDGVTLAGFSTRDEMCESFLWYYPRQPFEYCSSFYADIPKLFERFGILEVNWNSSYIDPVVTLPAELAGKTFTQVLNMYPWTDQMKEEIQAELRFGDHWGICSGKMLKGDSHQKNVLPGGIHSRKTKSPRFEGIVTYPVIETPYTPPDYCKHN